MQAFNRLYYSKLSLRCGGNQALHGAGRGCECVCVP